MTVIPIYFEAKQISTMNVIPVTYAADGTLTFVTGSQADLKALGAFDLLRIRPTRGLFEISSADAVVMNYQPGKDDFDGTISALDVNGKVNPLFDFYAAYDILKIVAQGTQVGTGGTTKKTATIIARIGDLESTWIEGKNASALSLKPCGVAITWA